MVGRAPGAAAVAHFSGVEQTAIASAPIWAASATAAMPTPPAAPVISTRSPLASRPCVTSP